MSDVTVEYAKPAEEIYLLPQEIVVDESLNVRPYADGDNEAEENRIRKYASEFLDPNVGQLHNILVARRMMGKGLMKKQEYVLVGGNRRRRAAILANADLASSGRPLFKLRATVDQNGGDLLRKAILSNNAAPTSPIDRALLIRRLREEKKWSGFDGAKKIADYCGWDVATVTQHERLLKDCSVEIQRALHEGTVSADTALKMFVKVKTDKQGEVLSRAKEIEAGKEAGKEETRNAEVKAPVIPVQAGARQGENANAGGVKTSAKATGSPKAGVDTPKSSKGAATDAGKTAKPVKVSPGSVSQAISEISDRDPDALKAKIPAKLKDVREWAEVKDGPGYGYPDGAVRAWVVYFIDTWLKDCTPATTRRMDKLFDAMVEKAAKGTAGSADDDKIERKTKSGRVKRGDAKAKAVKPVKPAKPEKAKTTKPGKPTFASAKVPKPAAAKKTVKKSK